ncbi:MAG: hypothetical protein MJ131_10975 [Lachnospiraceae bacterium]|nr:hypothetical protein [Lachnospiraceae bacterium]
MSNWGDDRDYELEKEERLSCGILLSFKSQLQALNKISDEIRTSDENYPKDCLDNIWLGVMIMLSVFILLTYNIVAIATIPFLAFYGSSLIKLAKTYKEYHYSMTAFWLKTIITLVIIIAGTTALKIFLLG